MVPLLLISLLALAASGSAAAASDPACSELGFTGEQLCSDCNLLGELVKDEELVADCKKCCVKDTVVKKYDKAELMLDEWRLGAFPQVKDFIDKRAAKFGSKVKILYSGGSFPKLRMSGPDGSDTVRIDNWKVGNIVEFLQERLGGAADK